VFALDEQCKAPVSPKDTSRPLPKLPPPLPPPPESPQAAWDEEERPCPSAPPPLPLVSAPARELPIRRSPSPPTHRSWTIEEQLAAVTRTRLTRARAEALYGAGSVEGNGKGKQQGEGPAGGGCS
jgi:hypothetical protein